MPVAPGSRVTRLELFYDLIFVFAFLNVTGLVSRHLDPLGLLAGAVVLALLWWCWTGFVALGNAVRADHGILPLIGFATMAAVFVLALAMPQAFVDRPGDLSGPAVFAVCYLAVRALTVGALWFVFSATDQPRRRLWLLTLPAVVAAGLIGLAAFTPLWLHDGGVAARVRLGLWLAALIVEYGAGILLPYTAWSVVSAGHFAERHGLIVLIALGESVLGLGIGPGRFADLTLTAPVIIAGVLGIGLISALWWLHFDTLALAIEQAMHGTRDRVRIPFARDVYTYLHLAIIIGIMFTALGLKVVLEVVAAPGDHRSGGAVTTLYGGVVLFLLAGVAAMLRTFHRVRRSTLVAVVVITGLAVVAVRVPVLVALGLLVAACLVLALVQRLTGVAERTRIRELTLHEEEASEAEISRWRRGHL
ncbi:low temperature requirement protein A [Polymorphospora rubra]|uniref:Low temperature requirement protein A n=1 Tax=Polymorphospora rubra TaxID=338584 RepID=A0A810N8Y4_9ACTN|nr:low temperature requirement protein A [Polymorphospora rubra]